jgi:NAD(P)-dependent dehydrogenase (short-subunit alcohol dehydrogenase family)
VADPSENERLVAVAEDRYGPVDLFCANAGIPAGGGVDAPLDRWQQAWDVNVMAHVHAARAVLPSMLARGEGYLLHTASAAGLLTNIGAAPYSVTKHAVVGLAEWISITHGEAGIGVSCLCPMGVRTDMLLGGVEDPAGAVVLAQGAMEPEEVADTVVEGLNAGQFLILPHPEVRDFLLRKADDHDRWIAGMRRLQARFV